MADEEQQIILIKKKSGHGGHHGGAWKVAYADFVTAMMSLFIVLWLMNSSKPIQDAVGGYFRDPHGTADKKGTAFGGSGDADVAKKEDMTKLQDQIMASLQHMPDFEELKKHVQFTVTPEGLRIELTESAKGTFFESGRAEATPALVELLKVLGGNIGILPNKVSIEGHTDSKPYAGGGGYGNWELSSDRANEARRLMEANGLKLEQVIQVRGFADRELRNAAQPEDPSNRRVTVIVEYVTKPTKAEELTARKKLSSNLSNAPKSDEDKPSAEGHAAGARGAEGQIEREVSVVTKGVPGAKASPAK